VEAPCIPHDVPSPIIPAAPPSQPRPPMAPGMIHTAVPPPSPPAPYGPAPSLQGAPPPPGTNPYQSQLIPPAVYPHSQPYPRAGTPQHGVSVPQAPAQPQVGPRKPERGTLPAIPATLVTPPMPGLPLPNRPATGTMPVTAAQPGSFPTSSVALPRIMVQYPQVGSKLPGSRGTYEVRDVIGAGEFGAVYECIGPFDQIYAVKMVRPSNRPYSEVHAEWAREVQRLFSLRHPNVVYIYDSFTHDHLFYLALERCDHALKIMLGTPMQEGLVLEISRQLLAAVQFLHDNDVVHDDLHAGNVLITHTDRPTVKISDFGISHELRGMAAVRPNVVHHAIMAPEILATGYTSRQSDIYQVGLLMYWMLAGESAMQMDVPYQELVRQVAEGEPRQRAEQLGTPLGQLIAKMLRRREAFRYTSAREVWADLRELPAWKQRDLFPAR
jgi:eukaryotic-like serine/threonine-protein kinase